MTLNFKKSFVWHMSNHYWERAMDKVYEISTSFMATHQRHLDKGNKNRPHSRFKHKKNDTIN